MTSLATCCWLILSVVGQGAESPKLDEKQLVKLLEPHFQQQAGGYGFHLDQDHKEKLELVEKPVMRWTSEGNLGAVWIWTRQGRAEVIGCLGAYVGQEGKLESFHEFHSLTLQPLQKVEISSVWTRESDRPGIKPALVASAEVPAATDKLRLIQMRNMAGEFSAGMRDSKQSHSLRLSPTPLYRYQSTDASVTDGAIFSYLWDNGTDPELLLVLEARQTPDGPRWHFAPARFTWREVWLTHGDKELWRGPEHNEFWKSRVLRDSYATCSMGVLDLDDIKAKQEADAAKLNQQTPEKSQ